jgi:hypothetical protein
MQLNTYWGDMHCNIHREHMPDLMRTFDAAREALDFFPIAYYPGDFYQTMEGLRVESVGTKDTFERDWERVSDLVRAYNEPGRFVTFPGYEWTGNRTRYGDHNVFYFDEGPLDLSWDVQDLFANLRERRAIAIPHHTGYQVGQRGKDWEYHDNSLSPFVEVFSNHGSSEGCNTPNSLTVNASMAPRVSGGTVQDGLKRGLRLGIMASNDSHYGVAGVWGLGLMAVLAPELTRKAMWEAFHSRRVYGVTGDRIQLDFTVNDCPMGSIVRTQGTPRVKAQVVCSQALDRVELLRNNRVVFTHCHSGTWDAPRDDGKVRAKLKVECGWGPTPQYNFAVGPKRWDGLLSVSDGRLWSVEPCFTFWGQHLEPLQHHSLQWNMTSAPRQHGVFSSGPACRQALIFELEAPANAPIALALDDWRTQITLADAMDRSQVVGFTDLAERQIEERFQLKPQEVENADTFWHNAYKVKIHTAIPEVGYTAGVEWVDENMPSGRNWYYLRVTQQNGQMAWSSPIWVESD